MTGERDYTASEAESVQAEKREIEAKMGTPEYWKDDTPQTRYLALVGGTAAPRKQSNQPGPGPQEEMRKIEKMMRNSSSAYWRGRDTEHLQARYRELLDGGFNPHSVEKLCFAGR